MTSTPDSTARMCGFCGYDLSGLNGQCPECGRPMYRFTDRARQALVEANAHAIRLLRGEDPEQRKPRWWLARQWDSKAIEPHHVLLGIISGPPGVGQHALRTCGTDLNRLRQGIIEGLPRCIPATVADGVRLPLSRSGHRLVSAAIEESFELGHSWVGTEHLLLALCTQGDRSLRRSLKENGVSHAKIRSLVAANMAAIALAEKGKHDQTKDIAR